MEIEKRPTESVILTENEIKDFYQAFIFYIDASKHTKEIYKNSLNKFKTFVTSNGIESPTRQDILNYKQHLIDTMKPSSVNLHITVLKIFFKFLATQNLYKDITTNLRGVKVSREHKKDYLSLDQVKRVLTVAKAESLRDYTMLLLAITTGLRVVEISNLKVEDLRVLGNSPVLYVLGKGRTEKTDFIKISNEVDAVLRNYIKESQNKGYIFTSTSNRSKGKKLSTRTISKIFKNLFIQSGLDSERITAHSTRHTAITLSLLSGQSLERVQEFARHRNITTTQIYAHHLEKLENNCSNVITDKIFK